MSEKPPPPHCSIPTELQVSEGLFLRPYLKKNQFFNIYKSSVSPSPMVWTAHIHIIQPAGVGSGASFIPIAPEENKVIEADARHAARKHFAVVDSQSDVHPRLVVTVRNGFHAHGIHVPVERVNARLHFFKDSWSKTIPTGSNAIISDLADVTGKDHLHIIHPGDVREHH